MAGHVAPGGWGTEDDVIPDGAARLGVGETLARIAGGVASTGEVEQKIRTYHAKLRQYLIRHN